MNIHELQKEHLVAYAKAHNYIILDDGIDHGKLSAVVQLPNGSVSQLPYQKVADHQSSLEVNASGMANGKRGNIMRQSTMSSQSGKLDSINERLNSWGLPSDVTDLSQVPSATLKHLAQQGVQSSDIVRSLNTRNQFIMEQNQLQAQLDYDEAQKPNAYIEPQKEQTDYSSWDGKSTPMNAESFK